MRVRISYGVELEDIPKLTARGLREAVESLIKRAKSLEESAALLRQLDEKTPEALPAAGSDAVSKIENLRETLSSVDATLADFSAILKGYVSVTTSETEILDQTTQSSAAPTDE